MRTIVIVNAAAGAVASGRPVADASATEPPALSRLQEAVRQAGLQGEVVPVEPEQLPAAVKEAAASRDFDAVCVAGGDGTVSAAASVMAGSGKPLGVLPLGTLNHFARDIGLPADPGGAAAAISAGHWRDVDVGEVNGRVFVNNCSMGLYPEAVRGRESRRDQGAPKWPAMLHAMRDALRRLPLLRLTLRTDDRTMRVATPLLMVGNNRYQTDLLRLGQRESLDEGRLWVYLTRSTGAGGVLKLGLRALAGRLEQTRDFESLCTQALQVDDRRRRRLAVAVDGEIDEFDPPLVLRSRPRSLRVLVPLTTPAGHRPPDGA
jgi:diacylglycerol kinase family enzyme